MPDNVNSELPWRQPPRYRAHRSDRRGAGSPGCPPKCLTGPPRRSRQNHSPGELTPSIPNGRLEPRRFESLRLIQARGRHHIFKLGGIGCVTLTLGQSRRRESEVIHAAAMERIPWSVNVSQNCPIRREPCGWTRLLTAPYYIIVVWYSVQRASWRSIAASTTTEPGRGWVNCARGPDLGAPALQPAHTWSKATKAEKTGSPAN